MKCCMSTDVGTCANWLTFEPDPSYSPNVRTRMLFLISYKCCNVEFYDIGKIPRIPRPPITAARRGFKMVLFTASGGNTFVWGTCALPSALLDFILRAPCSPAVSHHDAIQIRSGPYCIAT